MGVHTPSSYKECMETRMLPAEVVEGETSLADESGGEDGFDHATETAEERHLIHDVYNVIKDKLVAMGIPPEEIAFIHDCKTAAQRSQLFADVRAGKVRILLGSTEKMGTGMNAQERLIALHHLDAPWRPSDIEQRNGRILRQGNRYSMVVIINYVTEGSFDGFIWQILESKARFIDQIMRGEVTARSAEDVSDTVLSMAQIKALASGNPKVMQKVALESELTRLSHVYAAWLNNREQLRWDSESLPKQIEQAERELKRFKAAQVLRDANPMPESFAIDLLIDERSPAMKTFIRREDAGKHIRELLDACNHAAFWELGVHYAVRELGAFRGFHLFAKTFRDLSIPPELWVCAGDREQVQAGMVTTYSCTIGDSDIGIMLSIETKIRNIDLSVRDATQQLQRLRKRLEAARLELDRPWEHAEKYGNLKRQLAVLNVELLKEKVDPGTQVQLPEIAAPDQTSATEPAAAPDTPATVHRFNLDEILDALREMRATISRENVTPVPKIDEPLFKIGDWVVTKNGVRGQIVDIVEKESGLPLALFENGGAGWVLESLTKSDPPLVYHNGDRVKHVLKPLTGTVRSSEYDGYSVQVDQIAHAGGVPIGRVEHWNPVYMAPFTGNGAAPEFPDREKEDAIAAMERQIEAQQAKLIFGQASAAERKAKRPKLAPEAQIGFGW